jgi:hypothetical protein
VFATLTAPSFGPVHTRVELPGGKIARCRPRRKTTCCPHGRKLSCGQRHKETDACLGQPLCPDCYDYSAAVVWNAHAPELWRRTIISLRPPGQFCGVVRHRQPPGKPTGWDIIWGAQMEPKVVRLTGAGEITDVEVASYLAKYATKSIEPVGVPSGRITSENAHAYAAPRTHQERLIAACLRMGRHSHEDFRALRRWAHMLGYRGHFATKSRGYSTTMRALRLARRGWYRRQHPRAEAYQDETVVTVTHLEWAGRGWRTTGDALLALSAAARAREQRCIARQEAMSA